MTALNCKVGDLAIVVNSELEQNLGQIVEVLSLPRPGRIIMRDRGHAWRVRAVSGRKTLFYRLNDQGGRIEQHNVGPVPDHCLRPISGLADGDAAGDDVGERKSAVSKVGVAATA